MIKMTEKEFFDYLLNEYSEKTGQDLPADKMGHYLEYFLDNYLINLNFINFPPYFT